MKKIHQNIMFAVIIIAVAAIGFVIMYSRQSGGTATVTIAGGEALSIPLNKDDVVHIGTDEGTQFNVTLEVKDGRIHFINSLCPDHICENFGWLENEGDVAVCMPAGVMVSIEK